MTAGNGDTTQAAGPTLDRFPELLPEPSPLAQAFLLILLDREEARLAPLARMLALPLALAVRAATELTGMTDATGAPIAAFTPGRSPGAGLLQLTPAGVWLARQAVAPPDGQTDRTDH